MERIVKSSASRVKKRSTRAQHKPDPSHQQHRGGDPRRPEPLLEEDRADGRPDDDRRLAQPRGRVCTQAK